MLLLAALPRIYVSPIIPKEPLKPEELKLNEKYAFALLAFFYFLYGLFRRKEMLPRNPLAYLIALSFYVLALYPFLKYSPVERASIGEKLSYREFPLFYAYFAILSIAFYLIGLASYDIVLAVFIIDILIGIATALYLLYKVFHKNANVK